MTQRGTGPTLGQHTTSPTSDKHYDVWEGLGAGGEGDNRG